MYIDKNMRRLKRTSRYCHPFICQQSHPFCVSLLNDCSRPHSYDMPEALTPPRPASRASSRPKSPRPPSMPGLPRTTSQLSTISVQTRNHSSPRKLLSKTLEPPMAHPVEQTDESDAAALLASSSSSAHASTSSHSVSVPLSRRSSSTSLRSSRKGKEKAMDTMEGARETLRHIKLDQSESSTGRTARRYYVLTHAGKPVWCS
jgi:hypothetical protein